MVGAGAGAVVGAGAAAGAVVGAGAAGSSSPAPPHALRRNRSSDKLTRIDSTFFIRNLLRNFFPNNNNRDLL